jgi:thymidylate kinase
LVEGIPGSGKSDAAEYIVDCLTRRGETAEWFEENDYEHTADYTFHA